MRKKLLSPKYFQFPSISDFNMELLEIEMHTQNNETYHQLLDV